MLNVSIGAHIQTGLAGSRTRTTIEKMPSAPFILQANMHVQNQDSFLKIAQTAQHAATEVRSIFIRA